jgi:hypothetical protein
MAIPRKPSVRYFKKRSFFFGGDSPKMNTDSSKNQLSSVFTSALAEGAGVCGFRI